MSLQTGQKYLCKKTIRIDGAVWFQEDHVYLLKDCRTGHQGDVHFVFEDLATGNSFEFDCLVTDNYYHTIMNAFFVQD